MNNKGLGDLPTIMVDIWYGFRLLAYFFIKFRH